MISSLLILLLAGPGYADAVPQLGWRLDGSVFLRFGQGIETPHTAWARPSAAGSIKVLFLVNSSGAYDVPELARRADIQVHGMPADTWLRMGDAYWLTMWIASSTSSERAGHFEAMLDQPHDVIVLGNFRFLSLPDSVQYKILKQVNDGAGLVMFYAHDVDPRLVSRPLPAVSPRLAQGMPFSGLDFYRKLYMPRKDAATPDRVGEHLLKACQFGQGRVLVVDYAEQSSVFAAVSGGIVPYFQYDYAAPVQYDYHQSLAARCIQWAAGREPRLVFDTPLPDGMELEALQAPAPLTIRGRWSGSSDVRLTRHLRVRNRWGEVVLELESHLPIRDGAFSWEIALPQMPAGWHFVDLSVRSEQGVENWGSFAVDVRSDLLINAVDLDRSFHEQGQDVTGRVVLSRRIGAAEHAELELSLEDGYGRLFSRATQVITGGEDRVPFAIPQGNLVSWGARVRVRLVFADKLLHQGEVETRFRRPGRGEYPIAMWGAIPGYGNHIGNLQMRDLGFTAILADSPLSQARDDLGWMCFGAGTGALIHSLGDEISVPRPAKGSEPLITYLKDRYKTLDALNESWGTAHVNWEEVQPDYQFLRKAPSIEAAGPNDTQPASQPGDHLTSQDIVRFHDSVSSGERQYAEGCRKRREEIEKTNPPGVVGPEGSPVGDPELTLPAVTFWGPYLTVRDNLLVSAIASPGLLRGNWFGGYVEDRRVPTRLRHVLWMSILGGNNMIEYFIVSGGLLAPDLTRMPFTDEFMESWDQLRFGIGPLLAKCRPAGNPVALLHSQPSEHVGRIGGDATDTTKVHELMLNALGDAGYSPRYVASGQVKSGRLRQGDVKILFLLHAFALSNVEIAEITAFAEAGGTVIADIAPAWFDEHCRLRQTRGMDALFGVSPRAAAPGEVKERGRLMSRRSQIRVGDKQMHLRGAEPALMSTDNSRGQAPRIQEHGKGRFILLNGVLWQEGRNDPETVAALQTLVETIARTPRAFQAAYTVALNKLGTKVYSYQRGDIRIDAILPPEATDPAIPVVPSFRWPQARYAYDLRRQVALGRIDHAELKVDRASPAVVARLDYEVGRVEIEVGSDRAGDGVLPLACRVMDAQGHARKGHVLRVRVFDPAGRERPYYGAMLDGEGPDQKWSIPFALNDPPGEWQLTATDVISGQTAGAKVRR